MFHNGHPVRMSFSKYGNNRTAIELISKEDHQLYAMATVNVPDAHLKDDEVLIKNYSENKGILEMLERQGVVKRTGRTVPSRFVDVPVCKLLIPLKTN